MTLRLRLEAGTYAVARLGPADPVPEWAAAGAITSVTRTPEELSIVCAAGAVPPGARAETGWRALVLEGPIPFTQTGVLASLAVPLAEARIGLFVVSTYDTDLVLLKEADLARAVHALRAAGHVVGDGG